MKTAEKKQQKNRLKKKKNTANNENITFEQSTHDTTKKNKR